MKNNRYQAIILETVCVLVILSGDVHSSTISENFRDFLDDASYVVRQTTNEIRETFQPRTSWEDLPERLENTADRYGNRFYRWLVDFFDELPDLIVRRVDNTFDYIERQLDRLSR